MLHHESSRISHTVSEAKRHGHNHTDTAVFWLSEKLNCSLTLYVVIFTRVSYAEARLSYRLDVCPSVRPSVRHTLVLYQNG